jgi:predicted naringenin-chalcone synthase
MFITGVGTAVPERRYTQRDCWEALRRAPHFAQLSAPGRLLLERVLLGENGIHTRHLALSNLEEAYAIDPDVLARRFAENAPPLAARAAESAMAQARVAASQVDAIVISTCTGYLCPGLSSYVAEALGLRSDALGLDLVGQGCGAALPNLRAAEGLVAGGCNHVISICVEVCSAAFYLDDDPGVLVSACLFADGAGAAVLSRAPGDGRRVRWHSGASLSSAGERQALRMESRAGLLRNVLARAVPDIAARHASALLKQTLLEEGVAQQEVAAWIWHAGGRTVLDRLRDATALDEHELARSRAALSRLGNVSSAFVLFVLEAALRERAPAGWWWMSSFGAGFSCHGALLQVA